MRNSRAGFTLAEMCLVLFIIGTFVLVFAVPINTRSHTLSLQMRQIRAFAEQVQNEAVAERTTRSIWARGDSIYTEGSRLQVAEGINCSSNRIYFYPQYTAAPAGTLSCRTQQSEQKLVFQLGSGRSAIR